MSRVDLVLAVSVLLLCALLGTSHSQTVDSTLWGVGPSDKVFTVARAGNTIYIGGNFATIGPSSGGGVPLDMTTGLAANEYPKVLGRVNAAISDGAGGWFVGGAFPAVAGRPHSNLAHIAPTGLVEDLWRGDANGEVFSLALAAGVLYVGGDFDSLGGQPRSHIGAVAALNGLPTDWNPSASDRVSAIIAAGPVIFVGGRFTALGAMAHAFAAAIDSATAQPAAWDPDLDGEVLSLALQGSTLFAGGYFAHAGGTSHRFLVSLNTVSALALPWDPALGRTPDVILDGGPHVSALLVQGEVIYAAGSFKTVGGLRREGLAAIDIATGGATTWDPRSTAALLTGAYYRALAVSGDTLFVAGQADSLGGVPSSYLAAVSCSSAARFTWDPHPNAEVLAMAAAGGRVYAGGTFNSMGGWVRRLNLAAFDATTGAATAWDPEADDYVNAIVVAGKTVYVGGVFGSVGGETRGNLAALDAVTGTATAWNPLSDGPVATLALWNGAVIAGGQFTSIGGQPRNNLAAIDTSTGLATAWNPNANDIVYSVVPTDSVVYAGGFFTSVGGLPRATLAALDAATGAPTAWAPNTDGFVNAIAVLHGKIFAGGSFAHANGVAHQNLASFDGAGVLNPWSAGANDEVRTIVGADSTIYAGGFFSAMNGMTRTCLAALDERTGNLKAWYPTPDGFIWGLAASDGFVYAAGTFGRMGYWPHSGVAYMTSADANAPNISPAISLRQSAPNPTGGSALIRYSLPVNARVSLLVYDLQGRRVAIALAPTLQSAGPHEVSLDTRGWRPGCYLYRLQVGDDSATRKLVVVR